MKVFLSYASEDKFIAEGIYMSLLGAGFEVFFDESILPPGGDYHSRIAKGIAESDAYVFLISPNSVKPNRYVQAELKFAKKKWTKPWGAVLAVLIEKTNLEDIDPYLNATTFLKPKGNISAEVVDALKNLKESTKAKNEQHKKGKFINWLLTIIPIFIIFFFVFRSCKDDCCENVNELIKIDNMLKRTNDIYSDLKNKYFIFDTALNKKLDTYESYRYRREHNMDDTVIMRQQIESLMNYNKSIEDILVNYTCVKTDEFRSASDSFSKHAETTLIRFKSVDKLINTKEKLDSAMAFPKNFPIALKEQIKLCQ